ncbi:MAG: phosphoribosylformylglycinamidine cyclo-ligase [Candidatus Dadabacteria bacterium]|nr:MAG: phosphoribosylformylglycinamidine cyclo-ligase [Candidatus Dadabacteria bacterium]
MSTDSNNKESRLYARLGASTSKKGVLDAAGHGAFRTFFADVTEDVCGSDQYYSLLHADGAGTKAIAAYLAFKETDDPVYFRSLAQDSLVMNLDDVACVGAFESLLLSNTIGRNRRLIPDNVIKEIIAGYRDLASVLARYGIQIAIGGGETADLGDLVRTIVVDSTLFARVKRGKAIRTDAIKEGDVIVGLSSTGQAVYEDKENSGLGSNGYTLARHALIKSSYRDKYPEIQDPGLDTELSYRGSLDLFDQLPGTDFTVIEALLSPTRTYAPVIKKISERLNDKLHAAIHCSGGGQTKIAGFGNRKRYIKDDLFEVPAVCKAIQNSLNVPWQEMYTVFNMGHRMEIVCPQSAAKEVISISESFEIAARIVGYVEKSSTDRNQLVIKSPQGVFEY